MVKRTSFHIDDSLTTEIINLCSIVGLLLSYVNNSTKGGHFILVVKTVSGQKPDLAFHIH